MSAARLTTPKPTTTRHGDHITGPDPGPPAGGCGGLAGASGTGSRLSGLEGGGAGTGTGERIEFKLTNKADGPRILAIKDPTGAVAGEVAVEDGDTGELIVDLDQAGTWQIIVEGDGLEDLGTELEVS